MMRKVESRRTLGMGDASKASTIDLEARPGVVELDATPPDVIILCAADEKCGRVGAHEDAC
jgi:hypothetical protein